MNKVIFICVLSLSMCLSAPTDDQVKPPVLEAGAKAAAPHTEAKAPETGKVPEAPVHTANATAPTTPQATNATAVTPAATTNHTNETKPTNSTVPENKADDKKHEEAKPVPSKDTKNETKPAPTVQPTTVKPTEQPAPKAPADKNTPTPAKTTEAPKTDDTTHLVKSSRGFDGASFVGGIIMTLGLLAIGFIGLKYYRTQTERNYHTL
ncbi:unnamed protein product [Plutella xylostella]|uniref:(diamondback moth) hypothetical protein n=1 Tax=Plutella xylostella TaxID=51655 RepID=A0A8S4G4Z1_PLUXY|nr:unnamed protein product [Plutella xylostella]